MHTSIKSLLLISVTFFSNRIFSNANPLIGKDVRFAKPNEFPFIVSIGFKLLDKTKIHHQCGGSLITRRHVLTADHCMRKQSDNSYFQHWQFVVRVGSNEYEKGIPYDLESFMSFDQYAEMYKIKPPNEENDIAVIKLKKEVNEPGVIPIKLTDKDNSYFIGKTVKTAGWGLSLPEDHSQDHLLDGVTIPSTFTSKSSRLRALSLKVISPDECKKNIEALLDAEIDDDEVEKIICTNANPFNLLGQADSGGPLVYRNELIGVNEATLPQLDHEDDKIEISHRDEQNTHTGLELYREFIDNMLLNC